MNRRISFVLSAFVSLAALSAQAQQSQPQQPMSGGQMPMAAATELPEECRPAAQAGGQTHNMQGMMGQMQSQMQGMMSQMNEAQKGLHEAMMKMDPAMMQGMMAKDADVAWACSMIPHHQGAIDMSQVVLKSGDNAEAKKMAEKTIREQEKEIADLKEWLSKNAKKEGNQ